MAAGVIGSLAVSVVARVQKFQKDMRSAGGSVRQMANTARQAGSSISSSLGIFDKFSGMAGRAGLAGVALAAGVAINNLTSLNAEQLKLYDNVGKTSDKLGIQAERLQQLNYAGELTGVSTNTMNMALQRMTRRVAEAAQGTGEAKGALAELNINAKALAALSPDQQLAAIANEFSKIESQSDKVRLAFKLFDSEGVALVNTLALGVDGLNKISAEASRTGSVLSTEDIKNVEAYNDATERLSRAWSGFFLQASTGTTELRTQLKNEWAFAFESLTAWIRGAGDETEQVIATTEELNRVYDAQAAIREKQAKAEAKRKAERKKEFEELEKTIAAEKEQLESEIARTRLQGDTMGLSPEQQRIAELRRDFADNAINSETADVLIEELQKTEQIRKEREKIEELKKQEAKIADERKADAEALLESIKSPVQKMAEETQRIAELRSAGLINRGQHRTAIEQLLEGIGPSATGRLSGAMREGSREARSLELRGNRETKEDEVAKNTAEMRDLLKGILEHFEAEDWADSAAGEVKPWA